MVLALDCHQRLWRRNFDILNNTLDGNRMIVLGSKNLLGRLVELVQEALDCVVSSSWHAYRIPSPCA